MRLLGVFDVGAAAEFDGAREPVVLVGRRDHVCHLVPHRHDAYRVRVLFAEHGAEAVDGHGLFQRHHLHAHPRVTSLRGCVAAWLRGCVAAWQAAQAHGASTQAARAAARPVTGTSGMSASSVRLERAALVLAVCASSV